MPSLFIYIDVVRFAPRIKKKKKTVMKFFIMLISSIFRGLAQKYISFSFVSLYSINISIVPLNFSVELCVPIIMQYKDLGKELESVGSSQDLVDLEED